MNISMKLVYQDMPIFLRFTHFKSSPSTTSRDCDSNSLLVVHEDDNGKFSLERVKQTLNYWVKLVKCDENSLLHQCFLSEKILDSKGFITGYTYN